MMNCAHKGISKSMMEEKVLELRDLEQQIRKPLLPLKSVTISCQCLRGKRYLFVSAYILHIIKREASSF